MYRLKQHWVSHIHTHCNRGTYHTAKLHRYGTTDPRYSAGDNKKGGVPRQDRGRGAGGLESNDGRSFVTVFAPGHGPGFVSLAVVVFLEQMEHLALEQRIDIALEKRTSFWNKRKTFSELWILISFWNKQKTCHLWKELSEPSLCFRKMLNLKALKLLFSSFWNKQKTQHRRK